MTGLPFERRYLRPTVAHLIPAASAGLPAPMAACRLQPNPFTSVGWLGSGTQTEYDTAATLPLCKRCAKVATAEDIPF